MALENYMGNSIGGSLLELIADLRKDEGVRFHYTHSRGVFDDSAPTGLGRGCLRLLPNIYLRFFLAYYYLQIIR